MQPARILVCALSEFSACMQIRQYKLDRRHLPFRMNIHRNTATVVADGDRSVDMDNRFDPCAESCEMFVDRIIENFVNEMMQPAFVRITDEHARPLPNGFESFQLINLRRVVLLSGGNSGRGVDFSN